MKLIKLLMIFLVCAFGVFNASGQSNAYIGVLTQNSGLVNQGGTVYIEVTVGNTGPTTPIGVNKVRAQISVPSAFCLALPAAQQNLPPGWTVSAFTGGGAAITVCNGTDIIPVGAARTILIKVQGNNLGGGTVTGNLLFSSGTSCTTPGTLPGDQTADNSSTSSITVVPASQCILAVSASAGNVSCFAGTTTLTASSGQASNVEYSLNGGPFQTGTTFTVPAGTYTVVARKISDNTCTATSNTVTVTQPGTALSVTASSTNTTTVGGSDGTATANPVGGTPGYTYLWSPGGQTTQTATALTTAIYTVTVTDANGCIATANTTVSDPVATCNLAVTASAGTIACNGGSTTLTATATGASGTVEYSLNGGAFQSANTFTVNAAGSPYTVVAREVATPTCTATSAGITVTQPTQLVAAESHTVIACNGGSSTVTISATGGTTPYTGTGTFTQAAGTQSYTVTDANGCTSSVSVTVAEPSALSASSTSGIITCNGGTTTLTVTASGGTGPYQYSLNGGPPFQTANTFTVGAGNFTVTVKDANECTTTTSITIGQPSALVATSTAPPITVVGGTTTVTVSATGGTAPYTGTGTFVRAAGTYNFTVTDANGCIATTSITLTNPLANAYINVLTQNSGQVTQGGVVNVEITVGNSGPTGGIGPNRVRAQLSVPIAIVNVLPNALQTGLPAGWTIVSNSGSVITVCNGSDVIPVGAARTILIKVQGNTIGGPSTVTGNLLFSNGTSCTTPGTLNGDQTADNSSTSSIEVISGCNIAVTASAGTIACFGGTTTLTATTTGAAGTVEYSLNGGAFQAANTFTVNAAGSPYTIVAREVNNTSCSATSTAVTVTQPTQLVATESHTAIACFGGNSTVTISATGGTAPYTGTGTFTQAAGTQSYAVTDANGCTSVVSVTVTAPTQLVATETHTAVACNGGSSSVTISATGGTAPYTGTGTFSRTGGTYSFTVTDANGCTSSVSATITQPSAVAATATSTAVTTIGGNDGTATVTPTGGTSAYTYFWSPGGQTTATATGLTAGSYTVTVTDANGCTATATTTVGSPACNVTLSFTQTNVLCFGTATGSAIVTAANTTGTVSYSWNTVPVQTTAIATGLAAGTYTVTVTDGAGCNASGSVTITQPASAVSASATSGVITCNGGTTTLTVTASGGTGPYQYSLNGGPPFQTSNTFTVGAGNFTVTVKDANECTTTTSITIGQPSALVATSTAPPITVVGGTTTVTVSATGGTAPYTGTGTFVRSAGTYNFTVTDANGCIATTSITLTNPLANAYINVLTQNSGQVTQGGVVNVEITVGNSGPTGGIGPNRVRAQLSVPIAIVNVLPNALQTGLPAGWTIVSNSGSVITVCNGSDVIPVGAARTILIKVQGNTIGGPSTVTGNLLFSNGTSCTTPGTLNGDQTADNSSTSSIEVISGCNIAVTASAGTIACFGGTTTLTVTATGAAGTVEYSLNGGAFQAANTFTVNAAGSPYTIVAREVNNTSCSATSTAVTVTQPTQLVASSTAGSISCPAGTTTVVVSATGGTAPYTGTGTFSRTAGTYSFTVTDANGCTSVTSGTVTAGTDNTNPTITAPAALTVCTNSGCTATGTSLGTPVTTDNCSVASVTNNAPASFPLGNTTVIWTVTDGSGNTATATQVVTVNDCINPVIVFQGSSLIPGTTAASGSQTPYLLPTIPGVKFKSIVSVNDVVGGYRMAGIPDGLGAFDNNDGTFTLLMNHEFGNTTGVNRAHGVRGSFVSKWVINKSTLAATSGSDLMQEVYLWNNTTQANNATTSVFAFNRFCSGDLPAVSAYYNAATGLGTKARIYMHGEEGGSTGYQLGTVASGPDAGKCYVLGKFNFSTNGSGISAVGSWENALACPYEQNKTIVVGNNDGGTGIMANSVSVYVGTKTNTGSEVDKAGLTNGVLKSILVTGNPVEIVNNATRATNIVSGTPFTLSATASTTFSRPEDGAWDPNNPGKFYFVTTDQLDQVNDGLGAQVGRTRLWRLNFTDITNPDLGGTIDMLIDGTEGVNMLDNMTIDNSGHAILTEDVGNADHNGKIWEYSIATDVVRIIAKHDPARFGDRLGGVTTAPTAPFNRDEESSGVLDVSSILGPGMFLVDVQAHYTPATNATEIAEGGQLLAFFNPASISAAPLNAAADTIRSCSGTGVNLGTPATADNCSIASVTNNAPAVFPVGNTTVTWTVTDGSGNTATATQVVVVSNLAVTATSTAVTTIGGSDGTATAVVTGGQSPYTYVWSPGGQTTATATGLTAGTYTVTVTDAAGCIRTATVTVGSPACNVTLSFTQTNVLCFGGATGTATVAAANTSGTVSYSWNTVPFQTSAIATGLAAGTYTVTVTDGAGCSATGSVTITQPTQLVASSGATAIACNGGSSTVTVSATGGTAPYTGTGIFSRTAGTYSFTVTDANGCTAITSVTITEPTVFTASSSTTAIACNGGSSTVTVSATGGTAPYTGTGTFSRTAGTYSFTVTDANGCTAVTSVIITEPTALVASSSATAILCNGGSSTVTVSATGGTAPYTGTGNFSRTAGTYSFTVTDANGCTAVTTITIAQPVAVPAPTVGTITQPTCTLSTGSVVLNGLPATGTWTLTRNPGAVNTTGTGTGTTISGLAAGTYTFTVTNADGCTSTASANVVINTAPGAPSAPTVGTITQPTCTLSAGSVVLNGLPSAGTWTLTRNPGAVNTTGTGTSTTVSGLAAGTYTFTVTNAAGCTSSASANVVINAQPAPLVASSSATAILCNSGSSTVTVSATGGTAPYTGTGTFNRTAGTYTFTVTDAGGCSAVTTITIAQPAALVATSSATVINCNGGSSTVTVSATGGTAPYTGTGTFSRTAGTYTFTVTDANGCTAVTSITIAQPAVLVASSSATVIACNGGSSAVTVSATGGTAPYTGTGTFSRTAGTYTFTVTDARGCTAVTTITIAKPAVLVASSTATVINCNGGSSTVTVSATGGTAPYTGTGTFSRTAGTYSFTVTDSKGCTAVTTITITQPAVLVATSSATVIACNGGSSIITVSATGGTAPYTGTGSFSRTAGTYSFTVTDANGCTAVTSITIAQPAVLAVTASSTAATSGSNGTATATATGGTAPYTYLWTPGGQTTQTATGLAAGNYSVTVTDSRGCTATATVTVASNGCSLVINAGPDKALCNGASVTLAATISGVSAGLPPATPFTEVSGSTADMRLFSGNIDHITIGNTFSQSEDRNNCNKNATSAKTLTIPTGAAIKKAYLYWSGSGSLDNMVSLNGTSVTADGTKTASRSGGFSYFAARKDVTSLVTGGGTYTVSNLNWSNGSPYCYDNSAYGGWAMTVIYEKSTLPSARIHVNTEKFLFTYPAAVYSTTINNVSVPTGCTADAKLTIVAFEGDNYKGENLRIAGVPDADPNNFRGQNGPNLDIITKNAPGIVGGTTSLTYSIESYTSNTVFGLATEGLFDYVKVLKYNSCPAPVPCNVTYQWKRGTTVVGTTQNISVNTAGTYQVTATDCRGCIATDQVVVTASTLAATSTAGTIVCNGETTTVTVSATGGTAPYTGTGTFTKAAGTWNFTVTDATGCTAVTTVTIAQPAALNATSTAGTIACFGGTTTVTVSATGGTAPYTGTGTFTKGAGTWSFTVTDAKGCTKVTTLTITQPTQLVATATAPAIPCGRTTTTVTVSATGGTGPYTGTGTFTKGPGTYSFTVTDTKGCTAVATITIAQPSTLVATSTAGTIACYSGTTSVTVSASGGVAPYTGTGTFTKAAGTWNFTVKDARGCTAVTSVTITQPTQLVVTTTAPPIPFCGTTTTVTVSATGGTAPYTGTGTFTKGAGTYSFTVTDARGCKATCSITIAAPQCGPVDPNKCYKLVNRNSGKVLSIASCATSNNAFAEQQTSSNCSTFRFALTETGYYQIINTKSGKVLDVSGGSTADNANVQQYTYSGGNNQKWSLTASGSYFVIKAKHSGKAMSVKNAATTNGAQVVQKGTGSNTNEQWQIVEVACGTSFTEDDGIYVWAKTEFDVEAYPNPGNSYFNLTIKSSDKTTPISVRLLDVNGRVMTLFPNVEALKSNRTLRIEADRLAAGVYFAEVTQGDNRKTLKLVKVN